MPFYVSPEQVMKDRADYARKGIARGRSVVVLQYETVSARGRKSIDRCRPPRDPARRTKLAKPRDENYR